MVDDGRGDPMTLDDLKHTSGCVDPADAVLDVEEHHHGGEGLEGGNLSLGLSAVDINGQASRTLYIINTNAYEMCGLLTGRRGTVHEVHVSFSHAVALEFHVTWHRS